MDRATGAVNHAIDWQFRVGDMVKLRRVNEMDSDHPMHHPFHIHGAGRFVVLARDDVPEENLVWKDTVLVRTSETVDILLARLPDAEVKFVASTPGPKKTDVGLVLTADSALEDVPAPDVIVIPGSGKVPFLDDPAAVERVRRAHETSKWTTSVCTGSTLLGAAGVLQGKRATSHWAVRDYPRNFGAEPEYDPQPLYDSGSLEKADPETQQRATEILTRGVEQPVAR